MLALCYLMLISKKDEEELPLPKDAILQAIMMLTIIGTIFLTVSRTFMNVQNNLDNNQAELNRTFIK